MTAAAALTPPSTAPEQSASGSTSMSTRRATRLRPPASVGAQVLAVAGFLLLGTRQQFTVPFTGLGLAVGQLILFVLVALWALTRLLGQRDPAGLGVLTVLIVVRWALELVSYGLSSGRMLQASQVSASERTMAVELVAGLVVVIAATLLRSTRDVELVLRGLVAGGTLSAAFAVVQFGTGVDLAGKLKPPGFRVQESVLANALLREGLVRPQGAAAHPLELGGVTAVLVPVGLSLVFAARRRGERSWPWALATALIAAGGAVSLSRSVFLGIAVGVLVMMPRWPLRRAAAVVSVTAVGTLVASLAASKLYDALKTLITQGSDDYSLQSRADGRSYVWANFAHHFWFGQGPGTYDLDTQKILDNQYLSQLMETGVVGLLMMVLVLGCGFGYALWAARPSVRSDRGELASGIAGGLAAVLVVSLILDTAGFTQMFTLIWLLTALAAAVWRLEHGPLTVSEADVSPAAPVEAPVR